MHDPVKTNNACLCMTTPHNKCLLYRFAASAFCPKMLASRTARVYTCEPRLLVCGANVNNAPTRAAALICWHAGWMHVGPGHPGRLFACRLAVMRTHYVHIYINSSALKARRRNILCMSMLFICIATNVVHIAASLCKVHVLVSVACGWWAGDVWNAI